MLFSALFAIFILPVIYIIDQGVFSIPLVSAVFLIAVGILSFVAIFFYFKALSYTEASMAIPFFQLIPIFGFLLGFALLGETVQLKSIIAGLIIILGILVLSFATDSNKFIIFNNKVVLLMLASSFTYALYEVLFKLIAVKATFWISLFWQNVGLLLAGIILYIFIRTYRKEFHSLLIRNGKSILGLNFINEALNTFGVGLVQYASLLVPVVLVLLVNSLQPAIVFLMGILLTLFLPKISRENITKKALFQKIVAIFIVMIGTYYLYF